MGRVMWINKELKRETYDEKGSWKEKRMMEREPFWYRI